MLIEVFLCQDLYALRVPMNGHEKVDEALASGQMIGPERQLISAEEARLWVIKNEAKRLLLGFTLHKLNNISTAIHGELDFLLQELKDKHPGDPLIDSCLQNKRQWQDWEQDLRGALTRSTIVFEIQKFSDYIEKNAKLTKSILTKIKNRFDSDSSAAEETSNINNALNILLDFKDNLLLLQKADNVNEIVAYYKEMSHAGDNFKLCEDNLLLDRTIRDEALIVVGIVDNFYNNAFRAAKEGGLSYSSDSQRKRLHKDHGFRQWLWDFRGIPAQ